MKAIETVWEGLENMLAYKRKVDIAVKSRSGTCKNDNELVKERIKMN